MRARIKFLADRLRTGLQQIPSARISSPVHPELAGGIVVHRLEGVPAQKLQDELWLRGQLRVRSVGDALGVRQSCMIYNSEGEIDSTLEIVKGLHQAGTTIIIVEQSLNIAAELCDRAIFLEKGEIRFEGRTADLLENDDIARAVFFGAN